MRNFSIETRVKNFDGKIMATVYTFRLNQFGCRFYEYNHGGKGISLASVKRAIRLQSSILEGEKSSCQ